MIGYRVNASTGQVEEYEMTLSEENQILADQAGMEVTTPPAGALPTEFKMQDTITGDPVTFGVANSVFSMEK